MMAGHDSKKGWAMMNLQERIAKEREEIAKRVASFRATQEKFKREREEYFATTLDSARQENLRPGMVRPPFWS
jgi:chorismate mutase